MLGRIKKIGLPALVVVVIVAALVYRLSSCSSELGGGAPASAPAPVAPPDATTEPSFYTDEDIRGVFSKYGYMVRSVQDGGDTAAVEFYDPSDSGEAPSRFAWIDRETGAYDVVCDGLFADAVTVLPDNTLMVLTTGRDTADGERRFPEIFVSRYAADEDDPFTLRFHNEWLPYYMPADKGFTVGYDRPASLTRLVFGIDGVTAVFEMPPGGGDPEEAEADIPKTGVVCSGGNCYITFYNAALSPDFIMPKAGTGEGFCSFVLLIGDGTNTLLTLKLDETADRYNIAAGFLQDGAAPSAVFSFRSSRSVDYPPGW